MENKKKKNICVYCSSSSYLDKQFYQDAEKLGSRIGSEGFDMVYGGTEIGMMGVIASNAQEHGAAVTGVIPECILSFGFKNLEQSKVIITKDMRERKAVMEEKADIFIAAPGGFGTFEEVFEVIVSKQLGCHNKPVIFFNSCGYYDNLIKMFDAVYENKFAKEEAKKLYHISNTIDDIFGYIKSFIPEKFTIKW